MERQRKAQARHLALLSSDAPVMNRCGKEEAHLQQRLAQSTATLTRSARQNQAAAEREERAIQTHLQAQFSAILAKTPQIRAPTLITSDEPRAAADVASTGNDSSRGASRARGPTLAATAPAAAGNTTPTAASEQTAAPAPPTSSVGPSPACLLGFPEPFAASGFKSAVHWASVAYDETFLTAYGPRRLRAEVQANTVADAGGAANARDARPHRLMAAVACYLLNEVLCADATVSALWQEKLRQPIFDAVFSSQTIVAGQEKRRAYQSMGLAGNEAARSQVIVQQTLGAVAAAEAAAAASRGAGEREGDTDSDRGSSVVHGQLMASTNAVPTPPELPFPPRTNLYATRDDFASMRLWTEEVTAEQREKAMVCRRVRSLQHVMERRMQLLQVYQKQTNEATVRNIFAVWRTHTRHCRMHRAAMERYLENRHCRVLEENVFLRWRRVTLQTKVESLQRRMLNIVAEREEAARDHAAAIAATQELLGNERRRHQQAAYEQETLHTQILESHSMEVEALRLVLQQQRAQTAEVGKWAKRWERLAKTFRPSQQCPAVPPAMWSCAKALHGCEETVVATILGKGGDRRVLQQMPYSMVLPVRERLERLLLAWVNSVMEKSPLASSWVPLETFMHGRTTHPRSILVSQKAEGNASASTQARSSAATIHNAAESYMTEFGVYTLMAFIRELRRLYILAGKMPDPDAFDARLPRGNGGNGGRTSLAKCFREVVELLTAQTCAGLYPSLLTHCPSLSRWFTPEGIFGGPVKSFEGAGKERRLQHGMFVWLLTALLVGHIRLSILGPVGEKDDGLPPPASTAVSLRCSREAELDRFPQINFPVEGVFANSVGGGGSPGRDNNNTSTSVGGLSLFSRGTSVVAPNTLLSKKGGNNYNNSKSARASSAHGKGGGPVDPGTPSSPNRSREDAAGLIKGTVTLETALRERSQKAGAASTDAEDSLSDIEAYLGLLSTQAQTLRAQETHSHSPAAANAAAGSMDAAAMAGGRGSYSHHSGDEREDDLVNGLLQQLVGARDAAAQHRRTRRLQRNAEKESASRRAGDLGDPFAAFSNGNTDDDDDGDLEGGLLELESPQNYYAPDLCEGRTAAVLTEGQLRILRSLPSRSGAFDTLRPIPAAAKASTSTDAPGAATGAVPKSPAPPPHHGGDASSSTGGPSGKFYSFLLNMLEDVTRRQQWAALARVVTSLVVRFHILDDVEEGVQRAAMTVPARDEPPKEDLAVVSRPSSASRRPTSGSLLLSFGGTGSNASTLPQSARLPAVLSTSAREAAAAAATAAAGNGHLITSNGAGAARASGEGRPKKSASASEKTGAASTSLSARDKSRTQRVAATLVPSKPSPGTPPPPASSSDARPSNSSKSSAANPPSLRVTVANVGEDFLRTAPSNRTTPSPRGSASPGSTAAGTGAAAGAATVPMPPSKRTSTPLLDGHEMRVRIGEMTKRGQPGASASNSQRPSTSVDNASETPSQQSRQDSTSVKQSKEAGSEKSSLLPLSPPPPPQQQQQQQQQRPTPSPRPPSLPTSPLYPDFSSSPPTASDLPSGAGLEREEKEDTVRTATMDPSAGPASADLSIMSTPGEPALITASQEQMVVYVQKRNTVTPVLEDVEMMESPPPTSLMAPPSPPQLKDRKGTMQPSAVQADQRVRSPFAEPTVPTTAAPPAVPSPLQSPPTPQQSAPLATPSTTTAITTHGQLQHEVHASPTSALPVRQNLNVAPSAPLAPRKPDASVRRPREGAEGFEQSGEGGVALTGQVDTLEPLVEHGALQTSAAIENIRKYRFHMQPQ